MVVKCPVGFCPTIDVKSNVGICIYFSANRLNHSIYPVRGDFCDNSIKYATKLYKFIDVIKDLYFFYAFHGYANFAHSKKKIFQEFNSIHFFRRKSPTPPDIEEVIRNYNI